MESFASNKLPFVSMFWLVFLSPLVCSQLYYNFYESTCPNLTGIVRYNVWSAMAKDARIAASLLRLHFHDCFVLVSNLSQFQLENVSKNFLRSHSN